MKVLAFDKGCLFLCQNAVIFFPQIPRAGCENAKEDVDHVFGYSRHSDASGVSLRVFFIDLASA